MKFLFGKCLTGWLPFLGGGGGVRESQIYPCVKIFGGLPKDMKYVKEKQLIRVKYECCILGEFEYVVEVWY